MLVLVTTFLCAVAPALQATRKSQVAALKRLPAGFGRRWSLRNLLVLGQVAVALVLLLTAFLFLRNLTLSRALDPGFDVSRTSVALVNFVEGRYTAASRLVWLEQAVERLQHLPGVEYASYGRGAPLTLRSGMTTGAKVPVEGTDRTFQAFYQNNFVGPGYFETMGIEILKGRGFRDDDRRGGPAVIVVNEEFVRRYFPREDPLGVSIRLPGPTPGGYPAEIVGIARDSKYRTLAEEQQAGVYEAYHNGRIAIGWPICSCGPLMV